MDRKGQTRSYPSVYHTKFDERKIFHVPARYLAPGQKVDVWAVDDVSCFAGQLDLETCRYRPTEPNKLPLLPKKKIIGQRG